MLKSDKTNEAKKINIIEKMTNRIKAKFMKNQENCKNLTKPIVPVTNFPLAKSQNESNLKNPLTKRIALKPSS